MSVCAVHTGRLGGRNTLSPNVRVWTPMSRGEHLPRKLKATVSRQLDGQLTNRTSIWCTTLIVTTNLRIKQLRLRGQLKARAPQ